MIRTWQWEGIDRHTGKLRNGRIEAESEHEARVGAESAGVTPVSVKPVGRMMTVLSGDMLGKQAIGNQEKAHFYRCLALAAATDKPLVFALDSSLVGIKSRSKLRPAVARMKRRLGAGESPEGALASESAVLGEEAAAVYQAATQTGSPEIALEELSQITEQSSEIVAKVRVALMQPVMYIVMALLAMVVMLVFVMPSLSGTFDEFGGELPRATRIIMGISEFFVGNLATLGSVMVLVMIAGGAMWRRPEVRLRVSQTAHATPTLGPILAGMSTQRVCALIGVMLSADVPHETALRICAAAVKAPAVRHGLECAAEDLQDETLDVVIRTHLGNIDPSLEALAAQSMSGLKDPGANWTRYGQFKRRETERRAVGLTDALQPILIVVIGGLVGCMLIAFYLPMFTVFDVVAESSGL